MKQTSFFKTNWQHDFSHGGTLRKKRAGRGRRPLSTKEPLHLVFKVNRERLAHGSLRNGLTHTLVHRVIRQYAKRFFVKIEQVSVQADHCHLLIRAPRRSQYHYFFRVVAGQIAQRLEKEGLLTVRTQAKKRVTDTPGSHRAPGKTPVTDTPGSHRARGKTRESRSAKGSETSSQAPRKSDEPKQAMDFGHVSNGETRSSSDTTWYFQSAPGNPEVGDLPDSKLTASGTDLWKHRPFSRVVRGYRAYMVVRDYIQLNELEAQGRIPYRKRRLRGLSAGEWDILWA